MMSVCKKIVVLATIALLWCCNGDGTLLDLYPMEPIVNPETGRLIGENRLIHVDFDGRQRISGVTEEGVFTTADRFRSFDFESHPWQAADGLVGFGDGLAVHTQINGVSMSLRYSTDYGRTWATYDYPLLDGRHPMVGNMSVIQLLVSADRSVWLLCQWDTERTGHTLLYRVDLESGQCALTMEKEQATGLTCGFADSENGWLLYRSLGDDTDRVHVAWTENSGQTWTDGAVLDDVAQPSIVAVATDKVLVYNGEGTAFHSMDGGMSFESVMIGNGGVITCEAASAHVVYALLESGLAKSTDGGQTWIALDAVANGIEVSGKAMDFNGERAGIVYGEDRLFITNDGGQSWDILVYPYDYVFD